LIFPDGNVREELRRLRAGHIKRYRCARSSVEPGLRPISGRIHHVTAIIRIIRSIGVVGLVGAVAFRRGGESRGLSVTVAPASITNASIVWLASKSRSLPSHAPRCFRLRPPFQELAYPPRLVQGSSGKAVDCRIGGIGDHAICLDPTSSPLVSMVASPGRILIAECDPTPSRPLMKPLSVPTARRVPPLKPTPARLTVPRNRGHQNGTRGNIQVRRRVIPNAAPPRGSAPRLRPDKDARTRPVRHYFIGREPGFDEVFPSSRSRGNSERS
jgi:hypothetical protein